MCVCKLLQVFPEFFLHRFFLLPKTPKKLQKRHLEMTSAYSNPTHITLILFGLCWDIKAKTCKMDVYSEHFMTVYSIDGYALFTLNTGWLSALLA